MRKLIKLFYTLMAGVLFLTSCSEDEVTPKDNAPEENGKDVWIVNKEGQQALNVVYFKPTDFSVNANIINDISSMMIYMQAWYAKQMELQGYGLKTFGLVTNQNGKVKVNVVEAPEASESYQGNLAKVNGVVKEYFKLNPLENQSEHTIVLGLKDSGVGFVGMGKWCHATATDFSLSDSGKSIDGFTLMAGSLLGGALHELGHGLNLPHNCQKKSELPQVALMSYGNHTYQKTPELVFLTESSCAILNANPLFNRADNGINYYEQKPVVEMKKLIIVKIVENASITIEASFNSDIKVTHAYVGFDFVNEGASPPNDNYDEITYTVIPVSSKEGEYAMEFKVPFEELFNGYQTANKDEAEISLNIITENGIRKVIATHSYTTDMTTMVPNDDISYNWISKLVDRSGWTVQCNSITSNTQIVATNMLDGDYSTFWHSKWPYNVARDGAHEITIDMGGVKDIKEVYLFSNRDGNKNFRPKHIIIQTSVDGSVWTGQSTYAVASYDAAKEVSIGFANSVAAQYVKIIVDEIYTDSTNNEENLILSEVSIL